MKIKVKAATHKQVLDLPKSKKIRPKKPNILFRTLLKIASLPELIAVRFKCRKIGMDKLKKTQPCLYLMNHSSFIDLKIAASILYPRPFNIVCTLDGFVGKKWLMRNLGCIPTNKFVFDLSLVRSIKYCLHTLKSSVLMYPEAGYSFDGTSTTLPANLGKFVKMMGVPVVMITTYGAFSRQPLYNNLRKRKVKVSADMEYIISKEQTEQLSDDELQSIIEGKFTFDSFAWQKENKIKIAEPHRAEGLNRVLYKCPTCLAEGKMIGEKTRITCKECKSVRRLNEDGTLTQSNGKCFEHIPDWFKWQRKCVSDEIKNGEYNVDIEVDIFALVNTKGLYQIGNGRLKHSQNGFELIGCDGTLEYTQKPQASYSLNSDFFWYEMGDVISIGNQEILYYCFPKTNDDVVTKMRLATEEIFKSSSRDARIGKTALVGSARQR